MDCASAYILAPEFLCKRIYRPHGFRGYGSIGRIGFGMHHLEEAVERRYFAEKLIDASGTELVANETYAFKPYTLQRGRAVGEKAGKAHLRSFALKVEAHEATLHLHICIGGYGVGMELAHAVYFRLVDIRRREVMQQVGGGIYAEFGGQELGSLRAYSFYELYVGPRQSEHVSGIGF